MTGNVDRAPVAAVMPGLTGLRGIAALWVTAYHVGVISLALPSTAFPAMLPVTASGWLGVDLFFLLSGFVLMHAHAGQFATSFLAATPRFLAARCWRVYPLNAAVLALILGIVAGDRAFAAMVGEAGAADLSLSGFVRTLTLGTRWFGYVGNGWNGPTWSLSLELIGYLAFPVIAWSASAARSSGRALTAAAAALAVLLTLETLTATLDQDVIGGSLATWRMACEFVAGVMLYRARILCSARAAAWTGGIAKASVAIIVIAIALGVPGVACLGFAGMVWVLSFDARTRFEQLFSSRAALLLGRLSFPLYLVHGMALQWLMSLIRRGGIEQPLAAKMLLAGGIVAIVGVAWLLHLLVERPCSRRSSWILRTHEKGGPPFEAPPLSSSGRAGFQPSTSTMC